MPLGERVAELAGTNSLPAAVSPELRNELNATTTPTPLPLGSQSPLSDGEIDDNEPDRAGSPSLYDLKERKKRLLDALEDSTVSITSLTKKPSEDDSLIDDILALQDDSVLESSGISDENGATTSIVDTSSPATNDTLPETPTIGSPAVRKSFLHASKETVCGTPVIQGVSPFSNLPNSEKWREGVTDVLDFENLPESIGKYEKMRSVLEKVRVKVKKIQYEDDEDR